MKKIFGMLSLIAILTVSFTSNAVANDVGNDFDVEYVIGGNTEFVAVATVDGTNIYAVSVDNLVSNTVAVAGEDIILPDIVSTKLDKGVVNVSDEAENYAESLEGNNTNIVSEGSNIGFADFTKIHLPFEVGLLNENTTLI